MIFIKEGDVFLGDGIKFVCHYPFSETEYEEDENKNSMVLELKTWEQQILFTGDIEAEVEEAIEEKRCRYLWNGCIKSSTSWLSNFILATIFRKDTSDSRHY